ncbi:hypothetical protein CABS01_14187 [Colletotrichum abscissum]|uniref:uncharacterized protein n=1 Tax=Colletotrichum abscissum TaxID=1671311 RepID=UPI0027D60DBB|nr:uncharacterized protein CABS01_14187 [Colletotrichum abscissum]KAK1481989.1 hypothetical protein CABS01_14187 [Colletotrichum abscissum]
MRDTLSEFFICAPSTSRPIFSISSLKMFFARVFLPIAAIMASILAAPVQPKADLEPRFIYASPSIASFGDEGPVEDATTDASTACVECF